MMTRQDYVKLARALAVTRPDIAHYTRTSPDGRNTMVDHISYDAALFAWRATRAAIASELRSDNSRFDRGRFYSATEE